MNLDDYLQEQLQNPEFRKEYEALVKWYESITSFNFGEDLDKNETNI